ncbi:MAG: hypothetical protein ACYCPT_11625, partial [Acidimicrobiales bacterium]
RWTSYPNGVDDPGALNIELDVLSSYFGIPAGDIGSSTITIEGISLTDLQQSQRFANMNIVVKAGMTKGLPLANPQQKGVILQGVVWESFANWVGTEMNLNFVIVPGDYAITRPGNFVLDWKKGQPLSEALANTLQTAFPDYALVMNIGQYSVDYPVLHQCSTLTALAKFVKSITATKTFKGVDIGKLNGNTIVVSDGSVQSTAVALAFTDLIGQPKWVGVDTMQFVTVLRSDIQVNSIVQMPKGLQDAPGIVQTGAAAYPSQLHYTTTFQGPFLVQQVRHIGNFRDPNGQSWISVFQAVVNG